jgi:site-specific DNA recombinase
MKSTAGLRFAPLIRVSTEGQEKKGESLRTQRTQIEQYVTSLGGVIPDHCWKYSGQEHATLDQERAKLEALLQDSEKNLFDAVIVCDASRWSRDNRRSKQGLQILKKHNIRFFVGMMEYDLYSPEQCLFLGMATEINEFHARQQNQKSIINRINRAKRGIPTAGRLPYGRTFKLAADKASGVWGLDEEKAKNILWAAERYLAGESLQDIAKALGMNMPNLWKILNHRSGDTWNVRLECADLNIDETVTIKIPRLLPEETIAQIKARAAGNKTYTHGEIKHKYLLSRMVFCAECGYAMFGQTNHNNRRYYRHARHRARQCDMSQRVPAEDLERAIIAHLFSMYGDAPAIEKAIEKAFPNVDEIRRLEAQLPTLEKKLIRLQTKKENIIDAIAEGTIAQADAKSRMDKLKESEALLEREIAALKQKMESVPTRERIRHEAANMAKKVTAYDVRKLRKSNIETAFKEYDHFVNMPYEAKRDLVEHAFAGTDIDGRRLGVRVRKDAAGVWNFTIRGILNEHMGSLPLSETEEDLLVGHPFDPALDLSPEDFVNRKTKFPRPLQVQVLP